MDKIILHPEYDYASNKNDIAVVVLTSATSLDIPFPKLNSDDAFPAVSVK